MSVMSSSSALAGPSRLPLQRLYPCISSVVRRYASSQAASSPGESPQGVNAPAPPRPAAAVAGKGRDKRKRMPYHRWLVEVAQEYAHPRKGEKAKWLGGYDTPYATNPSFRPPPPLSNELQEKLYSEITKGRKTYEEVSVEYGVSKARLDAIRKLKEVEAEYKRQGIPLQTAFQTQMEPLLGVRNLMQSRWGRNEKGHARDVDQSTEAELEEEHRFESGIGERGSFGHRISDGGKDGIERTVFEWRAEDDVMESAGADGAESAAEDAFATPSSSKVLGMLSKDSKTAAPSHYVKRTETTGFRFIDVAPTGGIEQVYQVKKAMEKREKEKKRTKERREKMKGIF